MGDQLAKGANDMRLLQDGAADEPPATAREQLESLQLGMTIAEYRAWRERKRKSAANPPRLQHHPINQPPPPGRAGRR